jgi:hypothetical protein
MPFIAEPLPHTFNTSWTPEIVAEQPALQTEEGLAFEKRIRYAHGILLDRARPDIAPSFRQELSSDAAMRLSSTAALYTIGPAETLHVRNWQELALRIFENSRSMSPEETAQFDAISRADARPLSKPLKRFRSK